MRNPLLQGRPANCSSASGPPYDEEKDNELASMVSDYNGKVILCGGTTADIVARELNRKIVDELSF